jgi:hypothetical protein
MHVRRQAARGDSLPAATGGQEKTDEGGDGAVLAIFRAMSLSQTAARSIQRRWVHKHTVATTLVCAAAGTMNRKNRQFDRQFGVGGRRRRRVESRGRLTSAD